MNPHPGEPKAGGRFRLLEAVQADPGLTFADKAVFAQLWLHWPTIFPGVETIAAGAATTARTVQRCIKRLETRGYVAVERRGGRCRSNLYRLCGGDDHAIVGAEAAGPEQSDVAGEPSPDAAPPRDAAGDGNPDTATQNGDTAVAQNPDTRVTRTAKGNNGKPVSPPERARARKAAPPKRRGGRRVGSSGDRMAERLAEAGDYGAEHADPVAAAAEDLRRLEAVSHTSGRARAESLMNRASGADLRAWIARLVAEDGTTSAAGEAATAPAMAAAASESADPPGVWGRARRRLRRELGTAAFHSWIEGLRFEGAEGGEAHLRAPSRFGRDRVAAHYADRLRAALRAEDPGLLDVAVLAPG